MLRLAVVQIKTVVVREFEELTVVAHLGRAPQYADVGRNSLCCGWNLGIELEPWLIASCA